MSTDDKRPDAPSAEGLTTQLRALEAFAAQSEAAGDEMPPEALEMMARLREIITALDGLTASLVGDTPPSEQP